MAVFSGMGFDKVPSAAIRKIAEVINGMQTKINIALSRVYADEITLTGQGITGERLHLKQVFVDPVTMSGKGTELEPLKIKTNLTAPIRIHGSFNTYEELVAYDPVGEPGTSYLVGSTLYIWSQATASWEDSGEVKGPQGEPGPVGPRGVQGDMGRVGDQGIQGEVGPTGPMGGTGISILYYNGSTVDEGTTPAEGSVVEFLEDRLALTLPHGRHVGTDDLILTEQGNIYKVTIDAVEQLDEEQMPTGRFIFTGMFMTSVRGAIGPQGPTGPVGPTGATGATGNDGTSITIIGSTSTGYASPNDDPDWSNGPEQPNVAGQGILVSDTGYLWIWMFDVEVEGVVANRWVMIGPLRGQQGKTGPTGPGFTIKRPEPDGVFTSLQKLIDTITEPVINEGYLVQTNAGTASMKTELYTWDGNQWNNVGNLQGPQGPAGGSGIEGYSMLYSNVAGTGNQMTLTKTQVEGALLARSPLERDIICTSNGWLYRITLVQGDSYTAVPVYQLKGEAGSRIHMITDVSKITYQGSVNNYSYWIAPSNFLNNPFPTYEAAAQARNRGDLVFVLVGGLAYGPNPYGASYNFQVSAGSLFKINGLITSGNPATVAYIVLVPVTSWDAVAYKTNYGSFVPIMKGTTIWPVKSGTELSEVMRIKASPGDLIVNTGTAGFGASPVDSQYMITLNYPGDMVQFTGLWGVPKAAGSLRGPAGATGATGPAGPKGSDATSINTWLVMSISTESNSGQLSISLLNNTLGASNHGLDANILAKVGDWVKLVSPSSTRFAKGSLFRIASISANRNTAIIEPLLTSLSNQNIQIVPEVTQPDVFEYINKDASPDGLFTRAFTYASAIEVPNNKTGIMLQMRAASLYWKPLITRLSERSNVLPGSDYQIPIGSLIVIKEPNGVNVYGYNRTATPSSTAYRLFNLPAGSILYYTGHSYASDIGEYMIGAEIISCIEPKVNKALHHITATVITDSVGTTINQNFDFYISLPRLGAYMATQTSSVTMRNAAFISLLKDICTNIGTGQMFRLSPNVRMFYQSNVGDELLFYNNNGQVITPAKFFTSTAPTNVSVIEDVTSSTN